VQILLRERRNVRIHVIRHPVGNSCAHRYCLEAVARRRDERGNVPALAPAHRPNPLLIHGALRDQRIHAGNDVRIISDSEIAYIQRAEFLSVPG